jgi:ABC-type lipoprotein release transport system permease subunit
MRHLRLVLRLAIRNVRRQTRRSLLTAAATVLGNAVMVFSVTLGDGAHEDWIGQGVRLGQGHIAMQNPRFQATRNLDQRLTPPALARARAALADPQVASRVVLAAPRLEVQALASSATNAVPVEVTGVDPAIEERFSHLSARVVDGRYLEEGDRLSAFVGQRLARRLDLEVGSRLVLTGQSAAGEIAGQFVRVVGIFRSGIPEVDEGVVHIPLATAQEWLGVPGAVTGLAVLVGSSDEVDGIRERLRRLVGGPSADLAVLTWQEATPELAAAVRVDNFGNYLFYVILFTIVGLAIVNTVLMSVLYRTREFGVLRALGLTKGETAAVAFSEGVLLTVASGVVGMALGFAITWGFFRHGLDYSGLIKGDFTISGVILNPVIVPLFRPVRVLQGTTAILLIGMLASLYPAFRARRIDVAEAMKFEA